MTDINKTIPVITIKAGTAIRIELDRADGAFEIHFDTLAHPEQVVVKEASGVADSYERTGVLYCEEFSMLPPESDDCDSTGTIRHNDDDEYSYAIYWFGAKAWFNKDEQAWANERVDGCEYDDPSLAHEQANKLLTRHGLSEQIKVVSSDCQP